jgi:hypothetical protein
MLSERPSRKYPGIPNQKLIRMNPWSIRSGADQATIGPKGRIKGYQLRKLFKKGGQVFGFRMIAMSKIGSGAHAGYVS